MAYKMALDEAKKIHTDLIGLSKLDPQGKFDKITVRQQNFELILLVQSTEEVRNLRREIQNISAQIRQLERKNTISDNNRIKVDDIIAKLSSLSLNSLTKNLSTLPKREKWKFY